MRHSNILAHATCACKAGLPFKERFFPAGPDDDRKRIRLSTVRRAADASQLTDLTWPPFDAPPDAVLTREPRVFA